ncbi:MAG TPA: alpha/beta fold hydrolase, partial [Blastocatellia bacterium]|nr:alpha/beta fold hydrolase [Blastocatellia bacterium]
MISKMTSAQNIESWIACARPNPRARLRLFCFPYAGGSSASYRPWADRIPRSVELCAVQLPGRGSRLSEPPFDRLVPLVQAIKPIILQLLDKPFALFGHSMGARIAFELARLLRREENLEPAHLFISGCRAPQLPVEDRAVYGLPDPEFIDELRRLNGTPKEVLENRELMQLMIPLLRADFAVCGTYTYMP